MPRAFTEFTFTDSVKAAQERNGSRVMQQRLEASPERRDRLGPDEAAFLQERDGFYQASVTETGWPYVQFRGGPPGFVRVLSDQTLGYADFRGNLQYLSLGNLQANPRVAMIFMDYAHRQRLKVWGLVEVVEFDADLLARLVVPGYRAKVERAIVVQVQAFDWNCSQHITQRFTPEEFTQLRGELP